MGIPEFLIDCVLKTWVYIIWEQTMWHLSNPNIVQVSWTHLILLDIIQGVSKYGNMICKPKPLPMYIPKSFEGQGEIVEGWAFA